MEYRKVGQAVGVFGLNGELKIDSCTDFERERFKPGNQLYIYSNDQYQPVHVRFYRQIKGRPCVSFEEYPDINAVTPFKNCAIYIDKKDVDPLPEGRYYAEDLIDFAVYSAGRYLGKVASFDFNNYQPVMRVADGAKEVLVPFIPAFIQQVDQSEKRIDLNPEEGIR